MKFTVSKSALLRELQLVAGVTEKKTTIPVLGYLALRAESTGLHIQATDLDVSLTTHCEADVTVNGALCLSAKKLLEIVRSLPNAEVEFTVDDDKATIKCARSRYKLTGLGLHAFPEVAAQPEREALLISAATIRRMIAATAFAITQGESRYTLSGAKLEIGVHAGEARMVATDGHRLAFASLASVAESSLDVLIPRKTLAELAKLTADEAGDVGIIHNANTLFFRIGKRLLVSRTLSGQFPSYEIVLPKTHVGAIALPGAALTAAVRRVALMADESSHAIQLQVEPGNVTILAPASDTGEASEQLAIEYDGAGVTFTVNAMYLLDALSVISGDAVIQFKDSDAQIEIQPKDGAGATIRQIIMPMRG